MVARVRSGELGRSHWHGWVGIGVSETPKVPGNSKLCDMNVPVNAQVRQLLAVYMKARYRIIRQFGPGNLGVSDEMTNVPETVD